MFRDGARIYVKGGDGGNGITSFRREKFVAQGGPDGGDGGKGGDVILKVEPGLRTLVDFRYKTRYIAARGEHGRGATQHGRRGEDLIIYVPPGTSVKDEATGEYVADLIYADQTAVVVRGGQGGRGNTRFKTATRQAPRFSEKGESGEERTLLLELRVVADVGLVGYPNAGKSTLLTRISAARPKVADYPFTTLTPNLGVVSVGAGQSFVVADIPGLIEGAHEGVGLGHEFLHHVERARVLIHVVDVSGLEGRDPVDDWRTINEELRLYRPELAGRPQLVAANKMDLQEARDNFDRLQAAVTEAGGTVFPISAAVGDGVDKLLFATWHLLQEAPLPEGVTVNEEALISGLRPRAPLSSYTIRRENDGFVVEGKGLERLFARLDLNNDEAIAFLQKVFKDIKLNDALRERGIQSGDLVHVAGFEFEFEDD